MQDPALRQGDIVATKGFFVFVGHDEQDQTTEFVSAPGQPQRP